MGVTSDSGVAQPTSSSANLASSPALYDPDGDIVHPAPLGPGELREGTMIESGF